LVIVAGGLFFLVGPGKDFRHLWRNGLIQAAVDDPGEDRKYQASREANLRSLSVALHLYEKSEGTYPTANKWMDCIGGRLRSTDMSEGEAAKKLVRPNLTHAAPNQYGYALNDAVAGKFHGDIKDANTILVFESSDLSKNAHGSPMAQKGQKAITVGGQIVAL
jgi:hypothetical protein